MSVFYADASDLQCIIPKIRCKDEVYLSGTIYTARDAAHKRIAECINKGMKLPFELEGSCIYYSGPTPERPGSIIGSCGPTTSSRMDKFTPLLMDNGLIAMIGKGPRNKDVIDAIVKHKGIYFCAIGGAGALCAKAVTEYSVIAFDELGCESVKMLKVKDFPLICGIDCLGNSIFK